MDSKLFPSLSKPKPVIETVPYSMLTSLLCAMGSQKAKIEERLQIGDITGAKVETEYIEVIIADICQDLRELKNK